MLEHLIIGSPLKHTNIPKNGAIEFHDLRPPNLRVASITSGGSSSTSSTSSTSCSNISLALSLKAFGILFIGILKSLQIGHFGYVPSPTVIHCLIQLCKHFS